MSIQGFCASISPLVSQDQCLSTLENIGGVLRGFIPEVLRGFIPEEYQVAASIAIIAVPILGVSYCCRTTQTEVDPAEVRTTPSEENSSSASSDQVMQAEDADSSTSITNSQPQATSVVADTQEKETLRTKPSRPTPEVIENFKSPRMPNGNKGKKGKRVSLGRAVYSIPTVGHYLLSGRQNGESDSNGGIEQTVDTFKNRQAMFGSPQKPFESKRRASLKKIADLMKLAPSERYKGHTLLSKGQGPRMQTTEESTRDLADARSRMATASAHVGPMKR